MESKKSAATKPQGKARLQLKPTMEQKLTYMRAARPGKLEDWCLKSLDRAAAEKLMDDNEQR
jgi:hypothetical protein